MLRLLDILACISMELVPGQGPASSLFCTCFQDESDGYYPIEKESGTSRLVIKGTAKK